MDIILSKVLHAILEGYEQWGFAVRDAFFLEPTHAAFFQEESTGNHSILQANQAIPRMLVSEDILERGGTGPGRISLVRSESLLIEMRVPEIVYFGISPVSEIPSADEPRGLHIALGMFLGMDDFSFRERRHPPAYVRISYLGHMIWLETVLR